MKRTLVEGLGTFGLMIWIIFLILVAVALLSAGGLAINRVIYPAWLSFQRTSVESSKSFTDANNNMLESYKLEYSRLNTQIELSKDDSVDAAFKAQQQAILERMCLEISTMKLDTVNPATSAWLSRNGGCQ